MEQKDFFQLLEHTADMGIEAWGKELEEVFIHSGKALMSVIVHPKTSSLTIKTERVVLKESDMESLLFEWLNHLIYLQDSRGLIFQQADIEIDKTCLHLEGKIYLALYSKKDFEYLLGVKAVTYHQLEILPAADRLTVRFFLDV